LCFVDTVFPTSGALNPTVTALALGNNIGIAISARYHGLLILAGLGRSLTQRVRCFLERHDGRIETAWNFRRRISTLFNRTSTILPDSNQGRKKHCN
jgi:hypothetical protein